MAFQFKIQLAGITKPPVWRKVLVPEKYNFQQLHEVIQAAFGWGNYHLYQFSPSGYNSYPQIGVPDPEFDEDVIDSSKVKLKRFFNATGDKFTYLYDFGDGWTHKITLEKIMDVVLLKPDCIDGKGACPPEDCGGVWGYESLKETLSNPAHPEYEDMKEWIGLGEDEVWDAAAFDLEEARMAVRKV